MIDKALGYRLAASEKPLNRDVDSFEGGYEGTADERASPFRRVRHAWASADEYLSQAADSYLKASATMLLTMIRLKLGAFSAEPLVVLFVTFLRPSNAAGSR